MTLPPQESMTPAPQQRKPPLSPSKGRPPFTAIVHPPNPRRALVVGAADAACWAMQRALVEVLVKKGLMSKGTLCEEVRANYLAEREMIGEEAATHLRIWMQQIVYGYPPVAIEWLTGLMAHLILEHAQISSPALRTEAGHDH